MTTTPSQPATTKTALERLIDWLTKENETTPKHAGAFAYGERAAVDDSGGYGDVSLDDRPEFVKADDQGWEPIR